MAAKEAPGLYIAKESADLGDLWIEKGDVAEAGSEVVRRVPLVFVPLVPRFRRVGSPAVEAATAGPGEKRGGQQ